MNLILIIHLHIELPERVGKDSSAYLLAKGAYIRI